MDQPFYWDETVPFEMHPWTIQSSNNAHVDAHGIPSGAIDLVYSTDLHLTARTYYGYPAADGYLTQEQDVAIPGYPIPHACGG